MKKDPCFLLRAVAAGGSWLTGPPKIAPVESPQLPLEGENGAVGGGRLSTRQRRGSTAFCSPNRRTGECGVGLAEAIKVSSPRFAHFNSLSRFGRCPGRFSYHTPHSGRPLSIAPAPRPHAAFLSAAPVCDLRFLPAVRHTWPCTQRSSLHSRLDLQSLLTNPHTPADHRIVPGLGGRTMAFATLLQGLPLTAHEALSGVFGSISLASWIFLLVSFAKILRLSFFFSPR